MHTAQITARGPECTGMSHYAKDAVEADIFFEGNLIGSVVLLAAEDGRPRYETWGSAPDYWADNSLQEALSDDEGGMDFDRVWDIETLVTQAAQA